MTVCVAQHAHCAQCAHCLSMDNRLAYCDCCEMWLPGPLAFADHIKGQKHARNVRRLQTQGHATGSDAAQSGLASLKEPMEIKNTSEYDNDMCIGELVSISGAEWAVNYSKYAALAQLRETLSNHGCGVNFSQSTTGAFHPSVRLSALFRAGGTGDIFDVQEDWRICLCPRCLAR